MRERRSSGALRRAVLGLTLTAGLTTTGSAGTTNWQAETGDWFDAQNWSSSVPGPGDFAYIQNGGTALIASGDAVAYWLTVWAGGVCQSGGSSSLGELHLASGGEYSLEGGNLSAGIERIDAPEPHPFDQSGGSNVVTGDLYLAYGSGSEGAYWLRDGSLSAPDAYVGYRGTGTFWQDGGVCTVTNSLHLGYYAGSNGTYLLSRGTVDARDATVQMGWYGYGTFELNGGTLIADQLDLTSRGDFLWTGGTLRVNRLTGFDAGLAVNGPLHIGHSGGAGSSSYTVSSGAGLSAADDLVIGYDGAGTFTQQGPASTVTVEGGLYLGHQSAGCGSYDLVGGALRADHECVGYQGAGVFTQNGGTNVAPGGLYIGIQAGATGTYNLNGGSLTVYRSDWELVWTRVGGGGSGVLNQGPGSTAQFYWLLIGAGAGGSGTYNLTGGTASVPGLLGLGFGAGPGAVLRQTGGELSAGTLELRSASSVYELVDGQASADWVRLAGTGGHARVVQAGGVLSAARLEVGYNGNGTFVQDGGACTVSGELTIGSQNDSRGVYELNGGELAAAVLRVGCSEPILFEEIPEDVGVFMQTGGTNVVGELHIYPGGRYVCTGGSFDIASLHMVWSWPFSPGPPPVFQVKVDITQSTTLGGTGTLLVKDGSAPKTLTVLGAREGGPGGDHIGTVSPGHSTGTLTVDGNLAFDKTDYGAQGVEYGELAIEVTDQGHDALAVTGIASGLSNAHLRITVTCAEVADMKDKVFAILTCGNDLSSGNDRFGRVSFPEDMGGPVAYGDGRVTVQLTFPGDANVDWDVDVLDLAVLANHFGQNETDWRQADFNADGVVDVLDLACLANNFGKTAGGGNAGDPVPEPMGLTLVVMGGWLVSSRRRLRRASRAAGAPAALEGACGAGGFQQARAGNFDRLESKLR